MNIHYNLKNIRALLLQGFSDEDLRRFCHDTPDFRYVYDQLARNSSKTEIVDRLLEYTDQTLQIEKLLVLAKEHNSARYEKHQPYYNLIITHPPSSSNVYSEPQETATKKDKMGLDLQTKLALLIVSLITMIGLIISLAMHDTLVTPQSFTYSVRVQSKTTGQNISNAKVTIEVAEQAPLDEITDSNGFTRISIAASYIGNSGRLLIEAASYNPYQQEIDLVEGGLPNIVQLE